MKNLIFLILFSFLLNQTAFSAKVKLADAISKHQITVEVIGNGGYNGKSLNMKATNKTNYPLEIEVEAGSVFASADESVQDLMITQSETFALKPRASHTANLFTMCIQSHNMSPSLGDLFTYGRKANGDLLELAKLIDENDYQNSTAQSAVWSITDGGSITDIYGSDTAMVRTLAELISQSKNIPLSQFNFQPRVHQITSIKSSMEVLLEKSVENVSLKAYHQNSGVFFRELVKGQNLVPGYHLFKFGLNHTLGDSAQFILKLETPDGNVLTEKVSGISDTIPTLQPLTETFITFNLDNPQEIVHGVYDSEDRLYASLGKSRKIQAGFHRFDFVKSRGLPIGLTYFYKVKDMEGKTIAEQEIFLDNKTNQIFRPMTQRGNYRFKMNNDDPKYDLTLAVYDESDRIIWVVFENSRLSAGQKSIPYVFQHRQGPDATFNIKLTNKEGNVLKEQCISNCK